MVNKDRNVDFCNLVQTQNLLDLELHELRPILYPKLLHLMEVEKSGDDQSATVSIQKRAQSLDDIYIDENLIIKNQATISRSLLDDRCIVGRCASVHIVPLIIRLLFIYVIIFF